MTRIGGDLGVSLTVRRLIRGGPIGLLLLVGLLAGAGRPSTLAAQMSDDSIAETATGIEFYALAGVIQPLGNLTDDPGSFGTTIPPDVLFGADVTFWLSSVIGVGVTGLYSPATLDVVATQFQGAIPDGLGEVDYMAGAVSLTFRVAPSGSAGALEPYVSIGGGVRRLGLDPIAEPEVSTTDPMATIAGGIRMHVTSSIWLRGELRDIASIYESFATGESRLQNDVGILIGLGIR